MAHTRMSSGNTSHAPAIFKQMKVKEKFSGSRATRKPQPPANAPGQGHHHGGGYTPGATAGNLVTKGNLNIPSFMYKPYNKKPYIGKTHLYSYVPPVSRISDQSTRTHVNPLTVASTLQYGHAPGHGPQALPATNYSSLTGTTAAPKGALQQQGFLAKNQMGVPNRPGLPPILPAAFPYLVVAWRAGVILVYKLFGLHSPYDLPESWDPPPGTEGWQPSSFYGVQPGQSPWWEVPPGNIGEPPFPEP